MSEQKYQESAQWAASVIANVKADQMGDPTPCSEWDVAELAKHLVGGNQMFAGAFASLAATDLDHENAGDAASNDDLAAQYSAAVSACTAAYDSVSDKASIVSLPFGDMPASAVIGMATFDQIVHGWDLAKATNQDAEIPAPLVEFVRQASAGMPIESMRGMVFGAAIEVGADASEQAKVLGFLGRQA